MSMRTTSDEKVSVRSSGLEGEVIASAQNDRHIYF